MSTLLTLLVGCSLHFDDPLLEGVAEAFSRGNPFTVTNVAWGDGQDDLMTGAPQSRAQAEAELARIVAAGGEPVVGILPLRPAWLEEFGRPKDAAFDPCAAVEVATAKISEFDYECRRSGPRSQHPARRGCTLERYGASLRLPGLRPFVMASLSLTPVHTPASGGQDLFEAGGILHPSGGIFLSGSR